MKSSILLIALTVATLFGTSFASSQAEARGWGRAHFGFHHRPFVRFAPVYPVVYSGVCRWINTPYGTVRRCYY